MKNSIIASVLVKKEETAKLLKDSLSKFSCCQKISVLSNMEEALEYLNQGECTLLFIDEDYLNVLYTTHKPVFIVPICTKMNVSKIKKLMKTGCFDILLQDSLDAQLKIILGKIINIHTHYAPGSHNNEVVSDRELEYNASIAKFIFTEESIFLPPTKREPSVRILLKEILFIELVENKIHFIMNNGEIYERRKSLKYFIQRLPDNMFQKINQKTIVNVQNIDQITRGDICRIKEYSFKITRSFKSSLKSKLPL